MGGAIKMIVRFADDTVYAETRWTNNFSYYVCHPKTILGDESVMRTYVDVESEWAEGTGTMEPSEYGVFVVDFKTRTIISANDYSSANSWLMVKVRDMAQRVGIGEENGYTVFDEMLTRGLVSVRKRWRGEWKGETFVESRPAEIIEIPNIRTKDWDEKVYEVYRERRDLDLTSEEEDALPRHDVVFNYPGWTIENGHDYGARNVRSTMAQDRVRERLRELGFVFSKEDTAAYAEWHKERKQYEREDEEDA